MIVRGEVDASFAAVRTFPYSVGNTVEVPLYSPDDGFVVVLFIPPDIAPGTYSIPDAFAQLASTIAARFGVLGPPSPRYYENTGGTIVITNANQHLSGTFEFTALNNFTAGSVTVRGSFEEIPWGY